jgi:hypothetical protein
VKFMAREFDGDFVVGVVEELHASSLYGIPLGRIDYFAQPP